MRGMGMDLDLREWVAPMKGADLAVYDSGELTREDRAALHAKPVDKAPSLTRIIDRHHALARALAQGMKVTEAAYFVGYTPARVSVLKSDPMFQDLIKHYRKIPDALYADITERLTGMTVDALEELRRRVEEDPSSIANGTLIELVKLGADRTGYGPQTKNTNINIHANLADRLEAGRRRVQELRDITPKEGTDGN